MLVLSRRFGEEIWIGHDIRLRVADVRSRCVKIAIEAPAEVTIRRGELGRPASASNPTNGDTGDCDHRPSSVDVQIAN